MPVLFDSSVYIAALRGRGDAAVLMARWAKASPIWLSSVVLEELYAGANSSSSKALERLERDFETAKRILTPNLTDWTRTGKLLSQLAKKYGYEQFGRTRLTNDALIAATVSRMGITLITTNPRDFARLAEFCHFQWQAGVHAI